MSLSSLIPLYLLCRFFVDFLGHHQYVDMSYHTFAEFSAIGVHHLPYSNFPITRILVTSLAESLFKHFDWALTVARGQHGNFAIFLPVSGLPFPLLAPHLSPRSFIRKLYKGESGDFTIYQFLASAAATIAANLARF
jgi:hypothetical protein